MKFYVFTDPGHGWIKAPIALLKKLGISDQITQYSYVLGNFAYLEEDQDASTLIKALKNAGIPYEFRHHYTNNSSRIRTYPDYTQQNVEGQARVPKEGMIIAYGGHMYRLEEPVGWKKGQWYAYCPEAGFRYRLSLSQIRAGIEQKAA